MIFYVSHSIRGKYGKDATFTRMQMNCDAIIAIVKQLRKEIPVAEFYVPAESEPFVQRAMDMGYLTEKQILDIDCRIINDMCDAVIVYVPKGDELQGGRRVEYDFAVENHIPVVIFKEVQEAICWVANFILGS